jgi:hypothetical protein
MWRELRSELNKEGYDSLVLHKYRRLIKKYVKELGDRGAFDQDEKEGGGAETNILEPTELVHTSEIHSRHVETLTLSANRTPRSPAPTIEHPASSNNFSSRSSDFESSDAAGPTCNSAPASKDGKVPIDVEKVPSTLNDSRKDTSQVQTVSIPAHFENVLDNGPVSVEQRSPSHYIPSSFSVIEDREPSSSNSHVKDLHIGPGGADQGVDNIMGNPAQGPISSTSFKDHNSWAQVANHCDCLGASPELSPPRPRGQPSSTPTRPQAARQTKTLSTDPRGEGTGASSEATSKEHDNNNGTLPGSIPLVQDNEPVDNSFNVLFFKDAVGRKFSFPFYLVETWEVSIFFLGKVMTNSRKGMEEFIRQPF